MAEYAIKRIAKQAAAASVVARARESHREEPVPAVRSYRGVKRHQGKFAADIQHPSDKKRRLWLGLYKTPEEAAHAYDAAARSLQGARAKPNFPEPPPLPEQEPVYATLARFAAAHRARAGPAAAAPPPQAAPAPAAPVAPCHAIPAVAPPPPQSAPAPAAPARDTVEVLDPAPLAFAFPADAVAPPPAPVFRAPAPPVAPSSAARPTQGFRPYKRPPAPPPAPPAPQPQASVDDLLALTLGPSFFHPPPLAAAATTTNDTVTTMPTGDNFTAGGKPAVVPLQLFR
ncbi:hypothetical protein ACP4OV_014149 [Aristida adscensionis]